MHPLTGTMQLSLPMFAVSAIDAAKGGDATNMSPMWMYCSAGSRAKTSHKQGTVLAWKAHALVYGGKCFGSYAKYDPVQSFWKMSPLSRTDAKMRGVATLNPQTLLWSLVRLPKSGMTRNGNLYQLPMSAHLTSATDGFAWATPTASDEVERALPDDIHVTSSGTLKINNEHKSHLRLNQAVRYYEQKIDWHTPIANDGVKSGRVQQKPENGLIAQVQYEQSKWSTPRAQERKQVNSRDNGMALSKQVDIWSTPVANDAKNKANASQMRRNTPGLNAQVAEKVGDPMNPEWVEMLMGFPAGWTDIS